LDMDCNGTIIMNIGGECRSCPLTFSIYPCPSYRPTFAECACMPICDHASSGSPLSASSSPQH
jgi:hypothetical protein